MSSAARAPLNTEARRTLERAAELGMLGNPPIDEQIDHAHGFADVVERSLGRPPRSLLDLGSGGGLPGLVLHDAWPAAEIVLLDASERRTEFLKRELARLEEERGRERSSVVVVRGRAEEVAHDPRYRQHFEVVSARAFGRPAVVAECGAPFLTTGGVLVVSEPPDADASVRWPEAGLAELGLDPGEAVRIEGRFNYRVLPKRRPTSDHYPRRVGVPAKRPLF
jgi:16S rRNA (guanine527-N7)-methyltransferase